jgi:hypothetical protein
MKIKLIATVAAFMSFSSMNAVSALDCSAEDIQKKAIEITQKMSALAQSDPQKMQKLSVEYAKIAQEYQAAGASADLQKLCKLYDDLLAKMK